jgi:hypothetical protein
MMLTQDELNTLFSRYHDGEYADWTKEQAVFDIGQLMGHISTLVRARDDWKAYAESIDADDAAQAARMTTLIAAARGVVACVIGSANEPDPPSMMAQVCRVMRRTVQFERLEQVLDGEGPCSNP